LNPLRFDDFMHRALHDPVGGYYARRIRGIGGRGDFTTAPMLSDLPARAIARWAADALATTRCRDLIEVGPGEGTLAAQVLRHLSPIRRFRSRLHLVESSAALALRQKELLGRRVRHHPDLPAALAACDGRAVIYSNELVDAFPVRCFRRSPAGWQELFIRWQAPDLPTEIWQTAEDLPPSSIWQIDHPPGQRVEVHQSYHEWLAGWMPSWRAGKFLTIDYGAPANTLHHRRPAGSLRAYLFHQRLEGAAIYQNPGRQDLTADVNFTDLIEWARPWAHSHRLVPFADFLSPHATPRTAADHAMRDESGAGAAFLVLEQSRD
jgi:SAM-dependent MidA family methyltransferase